jgi:hypothetical protein
MAMNTNTFHEHASQAPAGSVFPQIYQVFGYNGFTAPHIVSQGVAYAFRTMSLTRRARSFPIVFTESTTYITGRIYFSIDSAPFICMNRNKLLRFEHYVESTKINVGETEQLTVDTLSGMVILIHRLNLHNEGNFKAELVDFVNEMVRVYLSHAANLYTIATVDEREESARLQPANIPACRFITYSRDAKAEVED